MSDERPLSHADTTAYEGGTDNCTVELVDTAGLRRQSRIGEGIEFYSALRTRRAGARRFVSMHLLVPGAWSVQRGHDLAENIEQFIRERLSNTTITVHLEPLEDPRAWADTTLDPVEAPNVEGRDV